MSKYYLWGGGLSPCEADREPGIGIASCREDDHALGVEELQMSHDGLDARHSRSQMLGLVPRGKDLTTLGRADNSKHAPAVSVKRHSLSGDRIRKEMH